MESIHALCEKLMPWYINGTLNEQEMQQLTGHLAQCEQCRADVDATQKQMLQFNQSAVVPLAQPDAGPLMARIGLTPPAASAAIAVDTVGGRFLRRAPSRSIAAVTAGLLLVLMAWQFLPVNRGLQSIEPGADSEPVSPVYTLLTEPHEQSVTHPHVVQLAFHPTTEEAVIRAFVVESGGTLLGNPTRQGVYRLGFSQQPSARQLRLFRQAPSVAWLAVEK